MNIELSRCRSAIPCSSFFIVHSGSGTHTRSGTDCHLASLQAAYTVTISFYGRRSSCFGLTSPLTAAVCHRPDDGAEHPLADQSALAPV